MKSGSCFFLLIAFLLLGGFFIFIMKINFLGNKPEFTIQEIEDLLYRSENQQTEMLIERGFDQSYSEKQKAYFYNKPTKWIEIFDDDDSFFYLTFNKKKGYLKFKEQFTDKGSIPGDGVCLSHSIVKKMRICWHGYSRTAEGYVAEIRKN